MDAELRSFVWSRSPGQCGGGCRHGPAGPRHRVRGSRPAPACAPQAGRHFLRSLGFARSPREPVGPELSATGLPGCVGGSRRFTSPTGSPKMREARSSVRSPRASRPQLRARVPHWSWKKGDCSMAAFGKGKEGPRPPLPPLYWSFGWLGAFPTRRGTPAGKSCTCWVRSGRAQGAYHHASGISNKDAFPTSGATGNASGAGCEGVRSPSTLQGLGSCLPSVTLGALSHPVPPGPGVWEGSVCRGGCFLMEEPSV